MKLTLTKSTLNLHKLHNFHCTQNESTNEMKHMPKTSIIMPGTIEIHRQVPLTYDKISKETKDILYEMLQNYKAYNRKGVKNDVGQTDLI